MATSIPQVLITEKNREGGTNAYAQLWKLWIDSNTSNTIVTYLTPHPQPVTFAGQKYNPVPMALSDLRHNETGLIQNPALSISNVTREAGQWLRIGQGFVGQQAELKIVHLDHLGSASNVLFSQGFRISSPPQMDEKAVSLPLALPHLLRTKWPFDRFQRNRCTLVFRDPLTCRYNGTTYTSCPKTLVACIARGDDEVTNNKPRLHPRVADMYPGLPEPRR